MCCLCSRMPMLWKGVTDSHQLRWYVGIATTMKRVRVPASGGAHVSWDMCPCKKPAHTPAGASSPSPPAPLPPWSASPSPSAALHLWPEVLPLGEWLAGAASPVTKLSSLSSRLLPEGGPWGDSRSVESPQPTFVKTRHHCQCRSFRYAAQFRCRTFRALSCCCFLAKALKDSRKTRHVQKSTS